MEKYKEVLKNIYDALSVALTAYEAAVLNSNDFDYDAGNVLYQEVCEIVGDIDGLV